jgi:hypothetical protein
MNKVEFDTLDGDIQQIVEKLEMLLAKEENGYHLRALTQLRKNAIRMRHNLTINIAPCENSPTAVEVDRSPAEIREMWERAKLERGMF